MLVTADNDVVGAVRVLQRILQSAENADSLEIVGVAFTDFASLGLSRDATDRVVWQTCQATDVVLITGNRSGGPDSLDQVDTRPLERDESARADNRRSEAGHADPAYADAIASRLLDFLERIESLRGTGRLFLP